MTVYRGEDMVGDDGYGTTEHALKSAHDALWAIANMQVKEETDKGEVLALCMSIARLELESSGLTKNKRYQGDTTMQEDIEDNKPHLCVPTLDGNAHVIPAEVFDKIVSGEMKITDMDDWEIITRTAFSEWLRGLETAAKTRVYKAAVDHIADTMAAGAWQDGPAPKDGSHILALFRGDPYVVYWDSWQTGETIPGEGTYIDGEESGWIIARNGDALIDDEPEKWARIIHPNRHMPASWDGPGDYR